MVKNIHTCIQSPKISRIIIRAATSENEPSDVRPAKIPISLRIRAVWSESSLGAFGIAKDAKFFHAGKEYYDQSA